MIITSCLIFADSSRVFAATCPEKGHEDWDYQYMCGCFSCKGTTVAFGDWPEEENRDDETGKYLADKRAGKGIIVKEYPTYTIPEGDYAGKYTNVKITYRCYNCGYISYDGTIYNKNTFEVWENVIYFEGTDENGKVYAYSEELDNRILGPQHEDSEEGGKGYGPGAVPYYECEFCEGLSVGSYKHETCYTIKAKVSVSAGGTVSFSDGTENHVKIKTDNASSIEAILGPNAEITINLELNDDYEFQGWSNGATENSITVTATKDTTYIAKVAEVGKEPTPTPPKVEEPEDCTHEYGEWETVEYGKNGTCARVCILCGYQSDAKEHTWVEIDEDKEQNDDGTTTTTTYYECQKTEGGCGDTYEKTTIACEHNYIEWAPDELIDYDEWEAWKEAGLSYKDYEDADLAYNPDSYHWKYCEYCGKTSGRGSHSGTGYVDEGDGYERNRCKTCGWILGERPVTVNIYLNPNGGVFPDGSTEMIEIGPFTYGQVTNLSVLEDEKYFPTMEGKDFFGYYVVEEGLSEAFYKPNWELGTLEGQPYFFGTTSNGEKYSKVKKAYTIHAQFKEQSYDVEYHPTNDLANPPTMAKSYHKVGVPSNLSPIGFYVTIPFEYNLGTVAGNVEVTVDQSFHEAKFLGWATSEERALAGIVDYEDKAEVTDLLSHAGTFHLYAVWDYGSIVLPNAKSANGGMKLEGWTNSDGDYYKVLNDSGNYAGNVEYPLSGRPEVLTATWVPNTYTVTLNSNGGTECSPIIVEYLGKYGTLPTPTRTGYTFAGWEDDITKTIVTETTTVTLAADHTLNAKWDPDPITVTLEYCFDSVGNPVNPKKYASDAEKEALTAKDSDTDTYSTYYNEFYSVLPTPSIDGYTFVGWYLEKADNMGCGHDTCLRSNLMRIDTAGNHKLYARWAENQYKINLDTNDGYSVWGKD